MAKTAVTYTITLPQELSERLETERGDVPRSTFIKRALEQRLGLDAERPAAPQPVRSVRASRRRGRG